jgi:hypothetical protein
VLHTPDSARAQCRSVHQQRVQLNFALTIQKAATTRIEGFIVFHHDDRCFRRIERRTAALEDAPSRRTSVLHAVQVSFDEIVRNCPRAAVNEENRIAHEVLEKTGQCSTAIVLGTEWRVSTYSWFVERRASRP